MKGFFQKLKKSKDLSTLEESCLGDLNEKESNYNDYLDKLKEKSKNAIRITEKNADLILLGAYREDYPEIHLVELYEDKNNLVYRIDKK